MARLFLGVAEEAGRLAALDELAAYCEFIGQRGPSRNVMIGTIADAYEGYPEKTIAALNEIKLLAAMAVADKLTDKGRNEP